MIKRDYYEVLEIERSSDSVEIKKAYRVLALKFHPDRNSEDPTAEEKFKEASEAYEVLSDPNRKQLYDTYGHQGLQGAGFHGFSNVDDIFASMGGIFEEFFGGMGGFGFGGTGGGRMIPRKGHDLRHDVVITFMEAAHGCEKDISVPREAACQTCNGTGEEPGTKRITCEACGGSGSMTQRQGFFVVQTTCPRCRGAGSTMEKPCSDCRGHGRVRETKKLSVKIPAGVEDDMKLVLRDEGEAGYNAGPAGDLYVFINVDTHDYFEREGDDLICKVPISFPQAALGCKIGVPSLNSEIEIKVPAGTETGDEVRIREKGFPNVHYKHRTGDQVVRFFVKTPKKLSKKQKELLEEFMKSK